jgi:hypothetical protein
VRHFTTALMIDFLLAGMLPLFGHAVAGLQRVNRQSLTSLRERKALAERATPQPQEKTAIGEALAICEQS